ncbi:MAG: hypothetical protein UX04_C0003G0083 [Microgenomates group bacterium GW2011_GWF2_45_18]|nr:MAG: hypothetical protein UW18_C0002G0083 [Microgenomates group bacterium GW2011_GWF1_44_10]KKU01811.1 MAG: hypothetical protein UX04_C0003G0083 [Microgenomates group bacterium GW2011_GWF2_45_18]OGJ41444.1 MAG: hypothetical protein A2378_02585 [Candidatus Pacebacteria bacterium RIFOXYB1_FULL_44_10]HAU98885.1 hypothetical protein [Candidatus Paceibacterota bacterium]HAX01157.1 hypothetical protein [Candidatus Paceibacterota bacterium]
MKENLDAVLTEAPQQMIESAIEPVIQSIQEAISSPNIWRELLSKVKTLANEYNFEMPSPEVIFNLLMAIAVLSPTITYGLVSSEKGMNGRKKILATAVTALDIVAFGIAIYAVPESRAQFSMLGVIHYAILFFLLRNISISK